MALARERLEFHGETIELPLPDGPGKALKLTIAPVQERIPIYLAAIGPKNTALAGEIADGWIPTLLSPEHLPELRASLEEGAARAGRSLDGFDIAPTVNVIHHRRPRRARATRCARSSRSTSAAWARASRTSTTSSCSATASRTRPREVQDLYLEGRKDEAMAALPGRADRHGLARRARQDVVRERLRVYRDAGVGTLGVTPMAFTKEERLDAAAPRGRAGRRGAGLRVLLGAFGDPGHAFPMHRPRPRAARARPRRRAARPGGAGSARRRARGAAVRARRPSTTSSPRHGEAAEALRGGRARASRSRARASRPFAPGRRRQRHPDARPGARRPSSRACPCATVIPHVDPRTEPGLPPYSLGARLPRTAVGARGCGARSIRSSAAGWSCGRDELNETRAPPRAAAARPRPRRHLAATWRSSRRSPSSSTRAACAGPATHVVGPLLWEPPPATSSCPPGDAPLVLVAPSTSQDPEHRLLRAALAGLADLPVRVLATWNRRAPAPPLPVVPANARLVEWVSYARTMPRCDLVLCHGGHGTVARALEARLRRRRRARRRAT